MTRTLLLLPGDHPGAANIQAIGKVVEHVAAEVGFAVESGLVGGASIDAYGVPITDRTMARAKAATAILYGTVGGPKWLSLPNDRRPSMGSHRLRQELNLYANVRPSAIYDELIDASSFKPSVVAGLDLIVVRELVGGLYNGKPRGIETMPDGQRRGLNTLTYTSQEIRRVARVAFECAAERSGRVCSVEKTTMIDTSLLWHQEAKALRDEEFPNIDLSHMTVDAVAHELTLNPRQFDVLLTDNMFGDILSDAVAGITGMVSMLPSAMLTDKGADGLRFGLYHQMNASLAVRAKIDKPNPLGTLLALAMALRYSFGAPAVAKRLEQAVAGLLKDGIRSHDMPQPKGCKVLSAAELCDYVLAKLR